MFLTKINMSIYNVWICELKIHFIYPFFGPSLFKRKGQIYKIVICRFYEKKLHKKFYNQSFKIGRSTAVLIFSVWPLKSG